ncbi:MAG: TatD family hydrolase [Candidatus Omnitrophica bacterium]|nr:TatD family hydrolase [Candidatus Omnitrophota bacterium]MDD5513682.1 TatD family hydrolase [Candidatus Omnitrophota bacterium]
MYNPAIKGLIDTHCHLDFPEFDQDRDQLIRASREQGLEYIINVGSSLQSSLASLQLAEKYDFIYAAIGIHPHEADGFNQEQLDQVKELSDRDKVVAVGEIGLDYCKNYSKKDNQLRCFEALLDLARQKGLPLVIHSRQAHEDTLEVLKRNLPLKGVLHCFSGDAVSLQKFLELGLFFSFTCNITYKKAQDLREIVKIAPLERIFLETDAPYLSPEGLRGRRNEPLNVRFVAAEIAAQKGISIEEVVKATSDNAKRFFSLE